MDWLIDRVSESAFDDLSVRYTAEFTNIERAVLALEDHRFYRHSGIDWMFIPRILRQIATIKRIGGVSTIEQQLVRTFLERRERTVSRKSREVALSWILSHRISKKDIVLAYLSNCYLGYRLRGVDAASQFVFGVDASNLDIEKAIVIASLLVHPLPKNVKRRASSAPYVDVSNFLNESEISNPKWTTRIARRINHGLSVISKTKEPR